MPNLPLQLRKAIDRFADGTSGDEDIDTLRLAHLTAQITLVEGERAVTVGGSAQDAVIISGDGNRVHIHKQSDVRLIREALASIQADRYQQSLQAYFRSIRRYTNRSAYVTLDAHFSHPDQQPLFVPFRLQSQEASDPIQQASASGLLVEDVFNRDSVRPIFLVGEPGSGKSTLLRHLAHFAWDNPVAIGLTRAHIPMIVRLQHLAAVDGASIEDRLRAALGKSDFLLSDLPPDFFSQWPLRVESAWLVLLDGLDEVPISRRPALVGWLNDLLEEMQRVGHRVVLTSRPTAADPSIRERSDGYTVLPFTRAQQHEFAALWFADDAALFLADLDRMRVGTLAGTPLLLTIAALLRRREGQLPDRRTRLYARFVEVWLGEAEQHGLRDELGDLFDVATDCLAWLALAVTEHPTATASDDLVSAVASYFVQEIRLPNSLAEVQAKKTLEVLGRRSGVLVSSGGAYEWSHPTFREYLASVALQRRLDRQGVDIAALAERCVDEDWREVLLFLMGAWFTRGIDVRHFLNQLVDPKAGTLHTGVSERLILAVSALGEGVIEDAEFEEHLLDDLIRRARSMDIQDCYAHPNALDLLGQMLDSPRAVATLFGIAADTQLAESVNIAAVLALTATSREAAFAQGLRALLPQTVGRPALNKAVLHTIDGLGTATPPEGPADRRSERPDLDRSPKASVRRALEPAASRLLARARDETTHSQAQFAIALELRSMGFAEDAADVLLRLARDPAADPDLRLRATQALDGLPGLSQQPVRILDLAEDVTADPGVRAAAASVLWKLGYGDQALPILISVQANPLAFPHERKLAQRTLRGLGR